MATDTTAEECAMTVPLSQWCSSFWSCLELFLLVV
jgi:hypothetical protein